MSNLHAYFSLRNLQGFSKALDGARSQTNTQPLGSTLSSSGGKSWTRTNALTSSGPPIDVNARDWLGRTILHIVCASPEPSSLAYVRLLLAHPSINVNIQDTESRWTALHRALYSGNIAARHVRFPVHRKASSYYNYIQSTLDATAGYRCRAQR